VEWLEEDGSVVTQMKHASCVLAFGEEDNEHFSFPSKGYGCRKVGC
jgi:hypothetical protein